MEYRFLFNRIDRKGSHLTIDEGVESALLILSGEAVAMLPFSKLAMAGTGIASNPKVGELII